MTLHIYYHVRGPAEAQLGGITVTFTPCKPMIVYRTSFVSSAWPSGYLCVKARSAQLGELMFFMREDALHVITCCDHCRAEIERITLCRGCFAAAYCSPECRDAAAPTHTPHCAAPHADDVMARLQPAPGAEPPPPPLVCNRRCRRGGMCHCVTEMLHNHPIPCKT